jgi:hypothetical protein
MIELTSASSDICCGGPMIAEYLSMMIDHSWIVAWRIC